jgi:hypothetical protein
MTDELAPRDRPKRTADPTAAEPIDDETLAAIIRDVADDWQMPPQRLDSPTWRDRIGTRARRPWLGRLARAGTLALAATMGLSLVAVWLSLPTRGPNQAGATPAASGAVATPPPTDRPSLSPLPRLTLSGQPPSATSVLVRVGPDYALADLTTGTLGHRITGSSGSSDLRQLADGRLVCLCVDTDGYIAGSFTHAVVSLRTYDRNGTLIDRHDVGEYTGSPDPRPGIPEDLPPHVELAVSYSADGHLGFVGWSARRPPAWRGGIVVVELASGRVVQRVALADVSTGPADAIVQAFPPRVSVSSDGGRALISRDSYAIDAGTVVYHSRTDHFVATLVADRIGTLTAFAPAGGCPDGQADAGFGSDKGVWLACWSANGQLSVRRLEPDGSLRDEVRLEDSGVEGETWLAAPGGAALYFWAPSRRVVSRLDLATGEVKSATAPAPRATVGAGPLAAIGRWLAPPAAAKVFLQPGLVLSPDGSRVYALGIAAGDGGPSGSTGVFSFDSDSLAPLANWPATADFVSLAVSRDGRFLYAAGVPGVDARGAPSGFGASITVYDSSDGSVRLVAGQLGHDEDLLFPGPIVP